MENQMSLIEIALELMNEAKEPVDIYTLIEETLAKKGLTDEDGSLAAKLYTDITISSKFVFMGDNKWDLKSRQSLDQFDKDGSSFNSKDDYDYDEDKKDEDDDLDESDLDLENEDEESEEDEEESYDEESEEDDSESESDDSTEYVDDENDNEDDSYDDNDEEEEKYNKIMDDYEDLYED